MKYGFLLLLFISFLGWASSVQYTTLLPKPQFVQQQNVLLSLTPAEFYFFSNSNSDILHQAFERYTKLIFYSKNTDNKASKGSFPLITKLNVTLDSANETLGLETNENYTLQCSAPQSTIHAATVYGALRALETFSQMIAYDSSSGLYLVNQTKIVDFPRFQYRGLLLDTSRHYLPLAALFENLDAMAYSKMNVLHWHIVDDQSFPYVSYNLPKLSEKGAFNNVTHIYTAQQIEQVIRYAKYRGIRVVPEFDTPGHTLSWGAGYPELLTQCYANGKWNGAYGPLNPVKSTTYTSLQALFREVASRFEDQYIHVGGDEVSFSCWQSNPDCQQWMKSNGKTNWADLESYYESNLLKIVAATGKSYIGWQEIFDNGLELKPDTVIEVWKGSWQAEMAKVTASGHQAILASCWYLNYISYGKDWLPYYSCDPENFNGTAAQKKLVMGGSACMWGTYVDATNVVSRTWPRASVVAERLWSAKDVTDVNDMTIRLQDHECRLVRRNINAEPANGPSFCEPEYQYSYIPPY